MDEYRIKNDIEEYLRNCLPEQFYQYAADRVYEIFEPAGYRKDMALKSAFCD